MRKLVHFVGLQAAWFAAALTAASPRWWVGVLANLGFVATHVALAPERRTEVRAGILASGMGFIVELVNQYLGDLRAAGAGTLPPLWLLSLWPAFSTTFMPGHSLAWLSGRPAVAAVLGATVGPLSYLGGARLGALEVPGARTVLTLAMTWGVAMPLLARLRWVR